MTPLTLKLLGGFSVELNGDPVTDFDSNKARALLAYLAEESDRVHRRESLATLLWPDYLDSSARTNLRNALYTLRTAIGDREADPPFLLISRNTIRFNPESSYWLDTAVIKRVLTHTETATTDELSDAVDLYEGDFLAGFTLLDALGFDDWASVTREGLRRGVLNLLRTLVDRLAAEGDHKRALDYARRRVTMAPWMEGAQRQLIQMLAATGQRSAALRQYERCCQILRDEMGADPSRQTTRLYEEIRRADLSGPAMRLAQSIRTGQSSSRATSVHASQSPAFLDEHAEPAVTKASVFVGRGPELRRLDSFLDNALGARGQVAFIVGGPGRGKTALMEAFTRRAMAAHPDLLVVGGTCNAYSGVGDAYLPFSEALAMLTGDVESRWHAGVISRDQALRLWSALPVTLPVLVQRGPSLLDTLLRGTHVVARARNFGLEDANWMDDLQALSERTGVSTFEQHALFQQLANTFRGIAQHHPILLLLDDLQWMDQGSRSLLFHLARQLSGSRILLVGAYRREEVALAGTPPTSNEPRPAVSLFNELRRRFGDVWIDLEQSDEVAGRSFVDALVDVEQNCLSSQFRQRLYERTQGHALFTVELLHSLRARGDLTCDQEGIWGEDESLDWHRLPTRVEAVIAERLSHLNAEQHDLLTIGSVEGHTFTAQVVARVTGLSLRAILHILSRELADRHRLIQERGEVRAGDQFITHYEFTHTLYREHLYQGISHAERRLLHEDVAEAIEAVHQETLNDVVTQLAYHYELAGRAEKSIAYAVKAGEQAHAVYADDDATRWYRQALSRLDRSPRFEGAEGCRMRAHTELGKIHMSAGEIAESEDHLREAIALAKEVDRDPQSLALLYHWLGEILIRQGRLEERLRLGEEGLALLGDDRRSIGAALMNQTVAFAAWLLGDWPRARALTLETASFIRDLPWTEELSIPYTHIGMVLTLEKDINTAMEMSRVAMQKAETRGGIHCLIAQMHSKEPIQQFMTGDLSTSIQSQIASVKIAGRLGYKEDQVKTLLDLAWRLILIGDLDGAASRLDQARSLVESAGRSCDIADYYWCRGEIALCRSKPREALETFRNGADRTGVSPGLAEYLLGRAYLALERHREALQVFERGLRERVKREGGVEALQRPFPTTARLLAGVEAAFDGRAAFRAWYRHRPELIDPAMSIDPWSLKEAVITLLEPEEREIDRIGGAPSEWFWKDPLGDNSYATDKGLTLYAANGRYLWHVNRSAPRLLTPMPQHSTSVVIQATCEPATKARPAIGGLLLWRDEADYLWLELGRFGKRDVAFGGCLDNQDLVIGRGRLPDGPEPGWAMGEPVTLRLEVTGDRVEAFCSLDEETWFSVGHTTFPPGEGVQVGVHAIGMIDRTVYHGAYPDGTAIRFTSVGVGDA